MVQANATIRITPIIPISNNSVWKPVVEMSEDVKKQFIKILAKVEFSLQLGESTVRHNKAVLIAYAKFAHDECAQEERLFIRSMKTDTCEENISLPWNGFWKNATYNQKNNLACDTDEEIANIVRNNEFIAKIK